MTLRAFSYGGGVQSTAALVLAARREIDFPLFIFANVGEDSENPATLRYVEEIAKPFAAAHGIELVEVHKTKRDGSRSSLYQDLLHNKRSLSIPMYSGDGGPLRRNCTSGWKVRAIAKLLRKYGATKENPAILGLGISLDEWYRMRTESGIPEQRLSYPLVDLRLNRSDCVITIERAGIPVPPKSSCYFCPYKSRAEWRRMRAEAPALFQRCVALERTLQERAASIGHKQTVWLSTFKRPLDRAVGDGIQRTLDEAMEGCESGYCHT